MAKVPPRRVKLRKDGMLEIRYFRKDTKADAAVRALPDRSFYRHPSGNPARNYWVAPLTLEAINALDGLGFAITNDSIVHGYGEMWTYWREMPDRVGRLWILGTGDLAFKFPFDREAIDALRSKAPGMRWDDQQHYWHAPLSHLGVLVAEARERGWEVEPEIEELDNYHHVAVEQPEPVQALPLGGLEL